LSQRPIKYDAIEFGRTSFQLNTYILIFSSNFAFHCETILCCRQGLCPTLISVLGMPKTDKKMKPTSDPSKNMDFSHLSPTTAKIVYRYSERTLLMSEIAKDF